MENKDDQSNDRLKQLEMKVQELEARRPCDCITVDEVIEPQALPNDKAQQTNEDVDKSEKEESEEGSEECHCEDSAEEDIEIPQINDVLTRSLGVMQPEEGSEIDGFEEDELSPIGDYVEEETRVNEEGARENEEQSREDAESERGDEERLRENEEQSREDEESEIEDEEQSREGKEIQQLDDEMMQEDEIAGEDDLDFVGSQNCRCSDETWSLEQVICLLLPDVFQKLSRINEMDERLKNMESSAKREDETNAQLLRIADQIKVFGEELLSVQSKLSEMDNIKTELSQKANMLDLLNKVDQPELKSVAEDLGKSIDETIHHLNDQCEKWKKRDIEVQQQFQEEIDCHVTAINNYLRAKLTRYNSKLNHLAKVQSELASVGAIGRPQLIRGQSCVACGAGIVMRCEGGLGAAVRALRPRSMRKYPKKTSAVRGPRGDYISMETGQQQPDPNSPSNESLEFLAYLANRKGGQGKRHCGGGHTITNAPQRVVRVGDFQNDYLTPRQPLNTDLSSRSIYTPQN